MNLPRLLRLTRYRLRNWLHWHRVGHQCKRCGDYFPRDVEDAIRQLHEAVAQSKEPCPDCGYTPCLFYDRPCGAFRTDRWVLEYNLLRMPWMEPPP